MTRATSGELDAFLAANRDLEAVEAFLTDASGVARGKLLRAAELPRLYRDGRPLPGSMLGLDTTGVEVDQTGLTWDTGDADLIAFPIPGSLRRQPWRAVPTAQVLLSVWESDGRPHVADPRHVLAGVLDRYSSIGIPVVAAELELYLVDPVRHRGLQPPRTPGGRRLDQIDAFSVTELEELSPFLDELFAAARLMELPAETAISESAPGQLEIVLHHRTALRAADDAVQWKRLVRGVAAKHGLLATFMAKPFTERAGSGLHLHASVEDRDGRNLFASEDPAGSPLLRHAIGGLLAMLDDSMAVLAPNANSYRRFQAKSYAPISRTWGINNRTVAIRVPTGAPATRHLEHRVAGADANPYLAIAAVLAGMHHGIVHGLDPGPATEGNGYTSTRRLPSDWPHALRRLRDSPSLAAYFGAPFLAIYDAIKTAECRRFHAQVTELDLAWYLTRA